MQLPLWPEQCRGLPNSALRSALFCAAELGNDPTKPREHLKRRQILAQDGISIVYSGERLDQCDLSTWMTILHIVRLQELADECRCTAYKLIQLLGKTDTGGNRARLDEQISRMNATAIDVKVGECSYEGSLIHEVYRNQKTGERNRSYLIRLNSKLNALFAPNEYTQIDWNIRQLLTRKPLAQWLHGYYSSHADPYPISAATLLMWSGSENKNARSSRQKLKNALTALAEACSVNQQPFCFEMKGDLVRVEKTPTRSQKRHIAKREKNE